MRNKFKFLKVFFSPFKPIYPRFHFGIIDVSVPFFYPRRWVKYTPKMATEKALESYSNYMKDWSFSKKYNHFLRCKKAIPKKIGFDFVDLGWKTKFYDTDFRYEWSPVWSFVFFKWQIAVIWNPKKDRAHYWECWLTYHFATDKNKTVKERIKQAREINPQNWSTSYVDSTGKRIEKDVCYWDEVLKSKYV